MFCSNYVLDSIIKIVSFINIDNYLNQKMVNRSYWPNNESWKQYWPYRIIALIATTQLIISFIVVAIQIAIVIIGTSSLCNGVTPRYVMGFVCWGFFIACWISIFCVSKYTNFSYH